MKSNWIILIMIAITGCSSIQIAYKFADHFIEAEVDRYLDLDSAGEELLERQIDTFLDWHRATMLPRYSAFLRTTAGLLKGRALTPASFEQSVAKTLLLWEDTVRGAIPRIATVLATQTSPVQLNSLAARIKERDKEILADMQRPKEEIVAERLERIRKGFERFMGDLNAHQLNLIRTRTNDIFMERDYWFRNRKLRQKALLSFLAKRPQEKKICSFLEDMLLHPHKYSESDYEEVSKKFAVRVKKLIYDVLVTLTPEQKATFVETLVEYAQDLSKISA